MSISRKNFFKLSGLGAAAGLLTGLDKKKEGHLNTLIKPERLKRGATLGLVAPASPIYNASDFDTMLEDLESLGYKLKLGEHVRDRYGYLAGKDEDRASDLMAMFKDDEVNAILCIRGGWGCNRILPLLDYDHIQSNPKPLIGFSDITSLHMAIQYKTGLVTFHGPVGKSDWNEFTVNSWNEVLIEAKKFEYIIPEDQDDLLLINPGKAQGKLLGGNLTVLTAMIGSNYLPDFEGAILFLEDVGEDAYRVDRMLTQLKLSGILDKINGFVFGKCTNCDTGINSLSFKEVFDDHISKLDIPAFYGAMISHENRNVTIPIGIQAEIDADKKTIRLLETGVV